MVAQSTDQIVRNRAKHCCEYCLLPEAQSARPFHVDHILAKQHILDDTLQNLALACDRCNGFKGPNAAGVDPRTRKIVPLYNPRTDKWHDHFAWNGTMIVGLTTIGMVTVHVLNMNDPSALKLRARLMKNKLFFPG